MTSRQDMINGRATVPMSYVRAAYREYCPDGHWFDPESMRFFESKLPSRAIYVFGEYVFVTSEKPPHGPRKYSVRHLSIEGDRGRMNTIGDFCSYSKSAAQDAARKFADELEAKGKLAREARRAQA